MNICTLIGKGLMLKRGPILLCLCPFLLLVSLYLFLSPSPCGAKEPVYHVTINGEIDLGLAPFIERVVEEAEAEEVKAIIFEINTFGGRLDAAVQIRDAILNARPMTIAYINERAISAGALISLACSKIIMAPGATIGAATPVKIDPFSQKAETAGEKVVSYFRKEMKATAEKNGRPTLIAEAFVDPDVEIEGVIEKGKLLTLTTSEAIQNKLADKEISDGIEGILAAFDLVGMDVVDKNPNWAETFLRFLSGSIMSSLLLTLGIIALLIEFRTPTWGVAGTFGLICLALFFWGHWVLNLVGWEELLLLAVGTILLMLEIFVIPGFGITGISGILALSMGIILSLVGRHPSFSDILTALSRFSIVFVSVLLFLIIFGRSFLRSRLIHRFVLHARARNAPGFETEIGAIALPGSTQKDEGPDRLPSRFIGLEGTAYTNLRPAGKGIFGNMRLNIETEGDFLEKGTPIRIIRIEGSKIIVKKIKGSKTL